MQTFYCQTLPYIFKRLGLQQLIYQHVGFFYNSGYCWKIKRKGVCGFGILVRSLVEKHQLSDLEVDGHYFKIYLRVVD
jgi:hypothetical protein